MSTTSPGSTVQAFTPAFYETAFYETSLFLIARLCVTLELCAYCLFFEVQSWIRFANTNLLTLNLEEHEGA